MSGTNQELSNYIEGFDVYNARLLDLLKNDDINWQEYTIGTFEYRPDLIAKDIYGSSNYVGILMISTALSLSDFKKGTVIRYIPKSVIDSILLNIKDR